MGKEAPFFTIVIPTKARPDLIDYVLFSLHNQTFHDFSVVISDDYDDTPCEHIVKKYQDERFQYVVPPKELDLGMCGNWEYGLNFADGKYVIFIQDKMFMYKDSLEYLASVIKETNNPDIISWSWDFFSFDSDKERKSGILSQKRRTQKYKKWDIEELVKEKISFTHFTYQNKTGAPGAASPLCSAIKHILYKEIKDDYGMIFDFINPDYGPPIRLLDYAINVYEIEDHLSVMMPVKKSEGFIHAQSSVAALNFLKKSPCGIERLKYAVIPELVLTDSNMVSADYNYSLKNSRRFSSLGQCDLLHALGAVARNLQYLELFSNGEKVDGTKHFLRVFNKLSEKEKKVIIDAVYNRFSSINNENKTLMIKALYRKIVPLRVRRFFNRFRKIEYHEEWFSDPTQSIDKVLFRDILWHG